MAAPVNSGPVDALRRAMANAPEQAQQALSRAMNRAREMWQNATQQMSRATEGLGDTVPDAAGDAFGSVSMYATDAIAMLPEVML